MTTEPTPLQERIARAIYDATPRFVFPVDLDDAPKWLRENVYAEAAAVLPIIAAEVRAGQARALRETADWWAANPYDEAFETPGDTRNWIRDTATEYETED